MNNLLDVRNLPSAIKHLLYRQGDDSFSYLCVSTLQIKIILELTPCL